MTQRAGVSDQNRAPFSGVFAFPERDVAAFEALPPTAKAVLLALRDLGEGGTYEAGQAQIAVHLERPLRAVERAIAALIRNGFVIEKRREGGKSARAALLVLHPLAATLGLLAQPGRHRRPNRLRTTPKADGAASAAQFRLPVTSTAIRCAQVRRRTGSRFLHAIYVVGLMTVRERALCEYAIASGAEMVCDDPDLSDELVAFFRYCAARDRFAIAERARGEANRMKQIQTGDVEHFINDEAA
jgi:hypothetical protein